MEINLAGTILQLLPQKAVFLPEQELLVLGDLHLGKAMHFRKAGIYMPAASAAADYVVLHGLLQAWKPRSVCFLGDLFHSLHNSEWLQFEQLLSVYPGINFTLVRGNHDVLDDSLYERVQVRVADALRLDHLLFTHEPMEDVPLGLINIAGHIHPGCVLRGLGRQKLSLPCFYLKGPTFLLPAFGQLTGLRILPQQDATVFAVLPDKVVLL